MYALKHKDKFQFECVANTIDAFDRKIENAYYSWKMIQSKGNTLTIHDFVSKFDKIMITIEPYKG